MMLLRTHIDTYIIWKSIFQKGKFFNSLLHFTCLSNKSIKCQLKNEFTFFMCKINYTGPRPKYICSSSALSLLNRNLYSDN